MDQGVLERQLPGKRGAWTPKTEVVRESNPTGQYAFEGLGLQLLRIKLRHPLKKDALEF